MEKIKEKELEWYDFCIINFRYFKKWEVYYEKTIRNISERTKM